MKKYHFFENTTPSRSFIRTIVRDGLIVSALGEGTNYKIKIDTKSIESPIIQGFLQAPNKSIYTNMYRADSLARTLLYYLEYAEQGQEDSVEGLKLLLPLPKEFEIHLAHVIEYAILHAKDAEMEFVIEGGWKAFREVSSLLYNEVTNSVFEYLSIASGTSKLERRAIKETKRLKEEVGGIIRIFKDKLIKEKVVLKRFLRLLLVDEVLDMVILKHNQLEELASQSSLGLLDAKVTKSMRDKFLPKEKGGSLCLEPEGKVINFYGKEIPLSFFNANENLGVLDFAPFSYGDILLYHFYKEEETNMLYHSMEKYQEFNLKLRAYIALCSENIEEKMNDVFSLIRQIEQEEVRLISFSKEYHLYSMEVGEKMLFSEVFKTALSDFIQKVKSEAKESILAALKKEMNKAPLVTVFHPERKHLSVLLPLYFWNEALRNNLDSLPILKNDSIYKEIRGEKIDEASSEILSWAMTIYFSYFKEYLEKLKGLKYSVGGDNGSSTNQGDEYESQEEEDSSVTTTSEAEKEDSENFEIEDDTFSESNSSTQNYSEYEYEEEEEEEEEDSSSVKLDNFGDKAV